MPCCLSVNQTESKFCLRGQCPRETKLSQHGRHKLAAAAGMPLSAQARVQTYVKLKVAIANREFNVDQPLLAFLIIHFVSKNLTSDLFVHLFSCGHRRVPFIAPLFTRQQEFFLGCHATYRSTRLRALLVRGAHVRKRTYHPKPVGANLQQPDIAPVRPC